MEFLKNRILIHLVEYHEGGWTIEEWLLNVFWGYR